MHLDTGALALGALPPDELPAAAAHVEGCDTCREELAGFRETVVRLAAVAAQAPPASLRRSVLAAVAVTPQLPPIGGSAGGAGRADRPAAPSRPGPGTPAPEPGAPATGSEPAGPSPAARPSADRPDNVRSLRPWYRRPAAWLAAAAAVVVLGGGLVALDRSRGPEQVAQTPQQCVAAAADRTRLTPANGQGAVDYAPSCAAVTVDVSGLPALPDDRTYQLWALSGEPSTAPRSLGLLPAAATGAPQTVTEPTRPGEVAVAITAEPAGGSATPTLPIVWTTELTS